MNYIHLSCYIFTQPTYDFIIGGEEGREESVTERTQPPTDNVDALVNEYPNEFDNIGAILY